MELEAFKLAIETLSIESSYLEVDRLENSIRHLKRSNDELEAHVETNSGSQNEDETLLEYVEENKQVIEMQAKKVALLKDHIGMLLAAETGQNPATRATGTGSGSGSGDDTGRQVEQNKGVFL